MNSSSDNNEKQKWVEMMEKKQEEVIGSKGDIMISDADRMLMNSKGRL